jgi:hypothetical protein
MATDGNRLAGPAGRRHTAAMLSGSSFPGFAALSFAPIVVSGPSVLFVAGRAVLERLSATGPATDPRVGLHRNTTVVSTGQLTRGAPTSFSTTTHDFWKPAVLQPTRTG